MIPLIVKDIFGVICLVAFGCRITMGGDMVSPSGRGGRLTGPAGGDPAGTNPNPILAKSSARVYNVKDYGAKGNNTADDTAAIQAAINAADTAAGTVWIPDGIYKHTGLVVSCTNNSGDGRQSHVSLLGENEIQTVLKYNGSTSGIAIQFVTNKFTDMRSLTLTNGVAKGTTVGLQTAGPTGVAGTYSNGGLIERVLIRGFHYGWASNAETGVGAGTSSEITAINLWLDNCDTGFRNNDFNGLNFTFIQLSISSCTTGVDANTAGIHVFGGAAANNTTDFHFHNVGTNGVYNFRSETARQFIHNDGSSVSVVDCLCEGMSGPTAIYNNGSLELRNSIIKGDVQVDGQTQLQMTDCAITSRAIIKAGSGLGNNRYWINGCSLDSGSGLHLVPNRAGMINSSGALLDSIEFDASLFGGGAKTAFFGSTPVAQQSGNAVTALSNYGLVKAASWSAASITGKNTLPDGVLSTNVPLLDAPSNNFTGTLQAGGYKSSDGTAGGTRTTGGLTFKNGLYTSGRFTSGAGTIVKPKTANYAVLALDSDTFFTNTGASGEVDFTLPTAVVGETYSFYVDAARTIKIIAGASATIQVTGSTSAAAGNITNATPGGCITLVAISTAKWVAASHEGTWTVK